LKTADNIVVARWFETAGIIFSTGIDKKIANQRSPG